jgi:uncharacterized protein
MNMNTNIVKKIYDAFANGDVPAVLNSFDPKIEWREPEGLRYADGNPYVGPQAVVEGVFQRVLADVRDFRVVPGRIIDGGDTVVVEGRFRGTMNATGSSIDAQFVHIWELRDGKIIHLRIYTDTEQWARAAGVVT